MPYPMVGEERLEAVRVRELIGDNLVKVKTFRNETYLCVTRDALLKTLEFLRDDPELDYAYFVECVGVDYSRWEHERDLTGRFEVIYNLFSLRHNARLFVKVGVDDGESIPTAMHIYAGAEYPEREIGDLYGIIFSGNELVPGTRFLLPDDWIGFPLRKEYPLGGDDVLFDKGYRGPAVEDLMKPHAGESFEGRTGSGEVSGR